MRHEFERADLNGDQLVSIDEFYIYFYSTLCFKFPMLRTGVNPGAQSRCDWSRGTWCECWWQRWFAYH